MKSLERITLLSALVAVGYACTPDTSLVGPGSVPVATVTVSPSPATVPVGGTIQLVVKVADAADNVLTGRTVRWTSGDAMLATVSASGLVTGVSVGGPVTITATSEGHHGTATITVIATAVLTGKIAFTSDRDGNPEIYVINADGSGLTRLTTNSAVDKDPAWSPDGNKIVFTSRRDGNDEIYVMNADGSSPTRITDNPAGDFCPAWSPDGKKIAFTSNRGTSLVGDIYVMNADGSGATQITHGDSSFADLCPAWSSDGARIAFSMYTQDDGGYGYYWIVAMDADGTNWRYIASDSWDGYVTAPAWSPDGTRIAFIRTRAISVANADGSSERTTGANSLDYHPAWSPDGTKIAFVHGADAGIYVMNADGSGQVRLTNGVGLSPSWKP